MKKTPVYKIVFALLGISLYACTKVITVNLNDAAPQVVIEGIITNTPGPYQVQITKTVNFDASNNYPPVSGATVKISDNTAAVVDQLTESAPGIYTTHTIQGIPGHSYQLDIKTADGQTYTATSAMPQPVPLDSISFQYIGRAGNTDISSIPNFKDPAGVKNYYSFSQVVNSRKLKRTSVFDDRLSDGQYISVPLRNDSTYINVKDTVSVTMNCIDKATYEYFYTLLQATGGSNFRSTASPSNPNNNLSNNALGYFAAYATQTRKAVVK